MQIPLLPPFYIKLYSCKGVSSNELATVLILDMRYSIQNCSLLYLCNLTILEGYMIERKFEAMESGLTEIMVRMSVWLEQCMGALL